MKTFFLYVIFLRLIGNPLMAILLLFLLYSLLDRKYVGLLPDFLAPFKKSREIKNLLTQLKMNPSNMKAALDLGILYVEKKKYEKALEYLAMANEKIDDSARLYLYRGMAAFEVGKDNEGVAYIHKALELDRSVGYGLPYIYLLQYAMNQGDSLEKQKEFKQAFNQFANTENFNRMGKVYKRKGDKAKAKEMFENSLRDYGYCPKPLRKLHRRWAISSRINLLFL